MKSEKPGKITSANKDAEILSISKNGIWIYVLGKESLLSFDDFPWFKEASVGKIYNFTFRHGSHLHWPDLDIDLHVDSLSHPEQFPLMSKKRRK